MTAASNEHVAAVNRAAQSRRAVRGDPDDRRRIEAADGTVFVGDQIVTRRNVRDLQATDGSSVVHRSPLACSHTSTRLVAWCQC